MITKSKVKSKAKKKTRKNTCYKTQIIIYSKTIIAECSKYNTRYKIKINQYCTKEKLRHSKIKKYG